MFSARSLVLLVASGVLAGLAGCVSTRGQLTSSTHRLEYNSHVLAEDAGSGALGVSYPTNYVRDAVALADDARELRHATEGGNTADEQAAFDRVSRAYHAVRDEVEHSDSLQARNELMPVTEAYGDVENELGYPPPQARAGNTVPQDR
jgi:hypothetical protein